MNDPVVLVVDDEKSLRDFVRQALDLSFDFEWSNKKLFYGLYKRTGSFFENSDMMARDKPSPEELALLAPFVDGGVNDGR